jgi:hypothetical protein
MDDNEIEDDRSVDFPARVKTMSGRKPGYSWSFPSDSALREIPEKNHGGEAHLVIKFSMAERWKHELSLQAPHR